MAKRKRLTPAQAIYLEDEPSPPKATLGPDPSPARPPIAQVAGDAATTAALRELSDEMNRATREGRLVQSLPLHTVETDHLVRDRVAIDAADFDALLKSLSARGQQTPIEVVALEDGRYGLISGWRRLEALRHLYDQTGEARFAKVQALLRRPEKASDAYLAMVEENEIRAGLSYYERARIAARAAEQGVYASESEALRSLFASASRAKRSKIGAFIPIYRALDGALRFPSAIPERLGLKLAKALSEKPALAARIDERLATSPPESADDEQAILARMSAAPAPKAPKMKPAEKVTITEQEDGLLLSGASVDAAFRKRLEAWLKRQG